MMNMPDKLKLIFCAVFRHSNIMEGCFGYMSCGRCGTELGDSLGGSYMNPRAVVVGHDCEKCFANYARLTWTDRFLTPYPFTSPTPLTTNEIRARDNRAMKKANRALREHLDRMVRRLAEQ